MGKTLVRLGLIATIVAVVALMGCSSKAAVSLPAGDRVLHLDRFALSNDFGNSTAKSGYLFATVPFTGSEGSFDSDAAEADFAALEGVSHDVRISTAAGPVGELYSWGKAAVISEGDPVGYELNLVFVVPDDASGLRLNWPDKNPIDLDPYIER